MLIDLSGVIIIISLSLIIIFAIITDTIAFAVAIVSSFVIDHLACVSKQRADGLLALSDHYLFVHDNDCRLSWFIKETTTFNVTEGL